uniref:UDP-glucose 4-epimerase n=1 Tax=Parastrongyloides trichosuri TaxID=131310 RepID=A0A0N4ZFK4_PARTI
MKILVTGAAGFIASHTVLELLKAGYEVLCIDNFSNSIEDENGEAISLKRVSKLVEKTIDFIKCDCMDKDALEKIFKEHKFDGVVHLAALKAVTESVQLPLLYYKNNLVSSLNLLDLCSKYNVKNFVFSSSATVYGAPESLPLTEDSPVGCGLTNPYGQTKYMIEQVLRDLAVSDKEWNIVILRYFNPVGAHESGIIGEDPKGIPNNLMPYIAQVAVGKLPFLNVYGTEFDTIDGTGVRDYIHIVDLAKGHVAAFDRIKKMNKIGLETYNLGTGTGYSVLQMVAGMEKACGHKIETKNTVPRPGDVASVYCDPSLALKNLGWKADFGVEEMCRDMWNWQSKNPNGYLS